MSEIRAEAKKNGWHLFDNEMEHSRGYPKRMRGDYSYSGNAAYFHEFADEFFQRLGMKLGKD